LTEQDTWKNWAVLSRTVHTASVTEQTTQQNVVIGNVLIGYDMYIRKYQGWLVKSPIRCVLYKGQDCNDRSLWLHSRVSGVAYLEWIWILSLICFIRCISITTVLLAGCACLFNSVQNFILRLFILLEVQNATQQLFGIALRKNYNKK